MKRLWAPWRMQYIEKPDQAGECIFCSKPQEDDEAAMVVERGESGFIMLNAFPYNNGHLLIAPYRHTADLRELAPEEQGELMSLINRGITLLNHIAHPEGYNVGANLGRVAGAGVADHIHFHIVPRWNGDTNFMPVVSDTKVLPEALSSVWHKLQEARKEVP